MGLVRQGLSKGGRVQRIDETDGSIEAIQAALREAAPEELILIQADTIDETVTFIRQFLAGDNAAREVHVVKTIDVPVNGTAVYATVQAMD
jgi:hypothetical protein